MKTKQALMALGLMVKITVAKRIKKAMWILAGVKMLYQFQHCSMARILNTLNASSEVLSFVRANVANTISSRK